MAAVGEIDLYIVFLEDTLLSSMPEMELGIEIAGLSGAGIAVCWILPIATSGRLEGPDISTTMGSSPESNLVSSIWK